MSEQRTIDFNTEKGQNSVSFMLRGILDSLILDTKNDIEIVIESEYGYLIFHRNEIKRGVHYLPIRIKERPNEELQVTSMDIPGFVKFNLNEEVRVTVIGLANTDVSMIFRFE